jgi:glycine hydroxymethyltransferase
MSGAAGNAGVITVMWVGVSRILDAEESSREGQAEMKTPSLAGFAIRGIEQLDAEDPDLYELVEEEYRRQTMTLAMVAASSVASPAVLACEAAVATNVTTEGYPGARFHGGCEVVDRIERLAIERAKAAFGARFANVQPHSGSSANEIVMFAILAPGDTILGMDLDSGGHLTHGSRASISGRVFHAVGYGVGPHGLIDYEQVARLANEHRPKLIIAGASSYPRRIDFARFREIADRVGAYLLADISHIAGLVAAGQHPSPIDFSHWTTTSTYKQLYGPRGGLILMGKDFDQVGPGGKRTLSELIQKTVFPFFQGTPNLSSIAAKARALAMALTEEFRQLAERIVASSSALAKSLEDRGYRVLTGGTDNHLILIDILANGVTGIIAERALEECGVTVNKNKIPGDNKPPSITSGLRLGTNTLAFRGMSAEHMPRCAALIDRVLKSLDIHGDTRYSLDPAVRRWASDEVQRICREFPLRDHPPLAPRRVVQSEVHLRAYA